MKAAAQQVAQNARQLADRFAGAYPSSGSTRDKLLWQIRRDDVRKLFAWSVARSVLIPDFPLTIRRGVSPQSLFGRLLRLLAVLLGQGHDVVHMRDRGWSGFPDHVLWRNAVNEDRTFVTINVREFRRLAATEEVHGGLITCPSDAAPDGQLQFIRRGIGALAVAGGINI